MFAIFKNLANSCLQTPKYWQTRVFARQTSTRFNLVPRVLSSRERKSGYPVNQGCTNVGCGKRSHVKCGKFANSKRLSKYLTRIKKKFYLSPTICQHGSKLLTTVCDKKPEVLCLVYITEIRRNKMWILTCLSKVMTSERRGNSVVEASSEI